MCAPLGGSTAFAPIRDRTQSLLEIGPAGLERLDEDEGVVDRFAGLSPVVVGPRLRGNGVPRVDPVPAAARRRAF